MDYNLYYVTDQILAPEFYFPCADFIYICKQPDYSEHNLNPYATVKIHICHIQFKIMQLSKYELGFKNITFQLWSDTPKNGCFTAKQAPEVRFKVLTVELLTSLLGMMLCHWARSHPRFQGSQ
jgi:hypothetical protein